MATRYNPPDDANVIHYVTLNVRRRKQAFRQAQFATIALEKLALECARRPSKLIA